MQAVREVVLGADDLVTEAIKWQAPTFIYKGNIASFHPKTTKHASLMFHRADDLEQKRTALQRLIREWIELQDAGGR